MAVISTSAIVLHTFPYGESSKIVRLATLVLGVLSAIAKGAQREKSRFGARLQLMSEGTAQLYLKQNRELQTLAAFDIEHQRIGLTHDIALPEWPPHRTILTMMQHYWGEPQHIIVHGDTHVASVETLRGVLLINPGSPMYPRNLDTRMGTLGFLEIEDGRAHAWLEQIDENGTHLIREQPKYI